jgi:hypothetical protein
VLQLVVTANVVPSSLILSNLKIEATCFSETSALTRATRRHIMSHPRDEILLNELFVASHSSVLYDDCLTHTPIEKLSVCSVHCAIALQCIDLVLWHNLSVGVQSCFLFSLLFIVKSTTCFGLTGNLQEHKFALQYGSYKPTATVVGVSKSYSLLVIQMFRFEGLFVEFIS